MEAKMFTTLAGRSVIVTGGSKGIGRGIARAFAKADANVLITGRDEASAQSCAEELDSLGSGSIAYFLGDVASQEDCRQMASKAVEIFGGIDVVCPNAGVFPSSKIVDMTPDDLAGIIDINLKGSIYAVQACLPELKKSGRGRVILTSSITGPITGYPGWSHYGATKAAQLGFMRTAAIELAPFGITVNAVLPGNIVTEGLTDLGPEYRAAMEAVVPQKRLGEVEDIGYAALYFATEQASYTTGQALVIDGGQTLPESPDALASM